MRDRPKGANLLRQARATLLGELLDKLPEDKHYDALMIAHARAIVARELEAGKGGEGERATLEALLGPAQKGDREAALQALNARLSEEIRTGRHDGAEPVHALLSRDTAARLALSNPKLLKN